MNTKHTPGPLSFDSPPPWSGQLFDSDRRVIADVKPASGGPDDLECIRNGRLLTAAYTSYDKHCGANAVECAEDDLLGELLEVCKRLEASLIPYRGEDLSGERTYLCGRAAISDIHDVLDKAGRDHESPTT